jgi:hypothetical protein
VMASAAIVREPRTTRPRCAPACEPIVCLLSGFLASPSVRPSVRLCVCVCVCDIELFDCARHLCRLHVLLCGDGLGGLFDGRIRSDFFTVSANDLLLRRRQFGRHGSSRRLRETGKGKGGKRGRAMERATECCCVRIGEAKERSTRARGDRKWWEWMPQVDSWSAVREARWCVSASGVQWQRTAGKRSNPLLPRCQTQRACSAAMSRQQRPRLLLLLLLLVLVSRRSSASLLLPPLVGAADETCRACVRPLCCRCRCHSQL